jgi:hypothetical protein
MMVTLSEIPTNLVPLNQLFWLSMNVYLVTLNITSHLQQIVGGSSDQFRWLLYRSLSITDSNLFVIKGQRVGSTHNNGTLWNDAKLSCN